MHALDQVRVREEYVERVVGAWSLRNACVSFYKKRNTTHLAQWVSRRGDAVLISGFSEYSNGFHRLSWVRRSCPPTDWTPVPTPKLVRRCSFRQTTSTTRVFSRRAGVEGSAAAHCAGHDTARRRHAGDWVGSKRLALACLGVCTAGADHRLVQQDCRPPEAAAGGALHGFGHVVGNTEAFEPRSGSLLPVLREFCRAALDNSARFVTGAGTWNGEADLRVLYVSRRGRRSLVNEDVVVATLRRQYSVRTVSLESLTVSDQLHLLSRTQVLVAAHGQALAYMPFLALAERAAVIELTLPHTAETWRSRLMYSKWVLSLHLAHFSAKTAFAPDCAPAATRKLHCPLVGPSWHAEGGNARCHLVYYSRKNISVAWCRHGGDIRLCGDQVSQHTS